MVPWGAGVEPWSATLIYLAHRFMFFSDEHERFQRMTRVGGVGVGVVHWTADNVAAIAVFAVNEPSYLPFCCPGQKVKN